jgi:hypothetical protein
MKKQSVLLAVSLLSPLLMCGNAMATMASATAPSQPLTVASPSGFTNKIVAPSCDVPSSTATHNTFYVDPVHGNINNNGSAAQPWDTLTNVFAKKATLLHGGDVVFLMSGDHGSPVINQFNSSFVSVLAAPGQTPTLKQITIKGSHWIFAGLKIEATLGDLRGGSHVTISAASTGATNNIIFTGNTVSSTDDSSSWAKTDWLSKAGSGIAVDGRGGTNCITVSNNYIYNTHFSALSMFADNSLATGNTIDTFTTDAIDWGGNNLILSHNYITNAVDAGDGLHPDGMQGFLPGGTGYSATGYTNVTLDSNTIIRQTNPNLKFANGLQGIDNFDSGRNLSYTNLTVTNNAIVTNSQGMAFSNVHKGLFENNTVLSDGQSTTATYLADTGPITMTVPSNNPVWLAIGDPRGPTGASVGTNDNVIVRNNLVQTLVISSASPTVTVDHNIAYYLMQLYANGKINYYSSSNYTDPRMPSSGSNTFVWNLTSNFVAFDPSHGIYDLHLKAGSPLIGMGTMDSAPAVDIANTPRVMPVSPGAYASPPATAYTGTITVRANARLIGTPKLNFFINGVQVGSQAVLADAHLGQSGSYTVNYTSVTKPQTLDVALDGYSSTLDKYNCLGVFNINITPSGSKSTSLLSQAPMRVTGQIDLSKGMLFYTNGSDLKYDISKL